VADGETVLEGVTVAVLLRVTEAVGETEGERVEDEEEEGVTVRDSVTVCDVVTVADLDGVAVIETSEVGLALAVLEGDGEFVAVELKDIELVAVGDGEVEGVRERVAEEDIEIDGDMLDVGVIDGPGHVSPPRVGRTSVTRRLSM